MDGAFVMHEKERNCLHGFCMKPGGKKHLEDLSIILKHLEESVWEGVDWIYLALDRDQ